MNAARRLKLVASDGKIVGEVTPEEYASRLLDKPGIRLLVSLVLEMSVTETRPRTLPCKVCGKRVVIAKGGRIFPFCEEHNGGWPGQKVCAGLDGECQSGHRPGTRAFTSQNIMARNGDPWTCRSCSRRGVWADMPLEVRAEQNRKRFASLSPEQRSERSRNGGRAALAKLTEEQRSERGRKAAAVYAATRRAKASASQPQPTDSAKEAAEE